MDVNVLRVLGLEKLLDYVVSGVGAIAGPMIAQWRASQEGKARLTSAHFDAEVHRVETESNAHSLQIIAEAQAQARQSIDTTIESGRGVVEITREDITQLIEFQGRKRLANTRSVVENAANELGDKEVSNHEPNHDWTARFFNDIQDVSSEEMQSLWAKVLAGEVEKPGSTSIQTLSILKNIDQATARLFGKLCSACISLRPDGNQFIDARVPSLGGDAAHNALEKYGLGFGNLNVLNEHGLVISAYNSWVDYTNLVKVRIPFSFQGRNWVLLPTTERAIAKELKIHGVALTRSGQELSRIVDLAPMNEYTQALTRFFKEKKLQMIEVDSS